MNNFSFSGISNFKVFMNIFIEFVSQKTKLYPKAANDLIDDLDDLPNRIAAYICNNDDEYRKARRDSASGFRSTSFTNIPPVLQKSAHKIREGIPSICFISGILAQTLFLFNFFH